jgi:hypothetical protein
MAEQQVKSKRGRKPKKILLEEQASTNIISNNTDEINSIINDVNLIDNNETIQEEEISKTTVTFKKRGRKPKGGKIIEQNTSLNIITETRPNIILHLKCSLKDLEINTGLSSNLECFDIQTTHNPLCYEILDNDMKISFIQKNEPNDLNLIVESDEEIEDTNSNHQNKLISKKLKQLEHNLHINNISDKKSACFWCTCDFDNPPIYIPKHFIKDTYHVYGCFCSPECATAFLMEENIDSSSKFERYHFLNHIYSKIYEYKKNIKPAPNPYYMLDKYYGNLSIQEYRSLLRNERLFLIVDKPLTRIMPELHEDNDDFIINNKIIPSNSYQMKRKINKKTQNKTSIMNEKFGLTS